MKVLRTALLATALVVGLGACNDRPAPSAHDSSTGVGDGLGDGIGDTVDRAMSEAADKLATENITLSENGRKAEISPKGDLVIDGRPVAVNDAQRAQLLQYRAQVMEVAQAGMAMGAEGARLAGHAVTEALGGLFSGRPDRIGERVQAQAQGLKDRALKICERLPAMYVAQQQLAQSIPAFAPFATMKPESTADCVRDIKSEGDLPQPPAAPDSPAAPPAPPAPRADASKTAERAITAREPFDEPRLPNPPKPSTANGPVGG